jgi:hypothetical protein
MMKKSSDCRRIWYLYLQSALALAYSSIALLSKVASEAAVELSFSAQEFIHRKQPYRLTNEHIGNELFIKMIAIHLINNSSVPSPSFPSMKKDAVQVLDEEYNHVENPDEVKLFLLESESDKEDEVQDEEDDNPSISLNVISLANTISSEAGKYICSRYPGQTEISGS